MAQKFWINKNIFITGCTGLLGSWLTETLVEQGANVIGLIRDTVPKSNLNLSGFIEDINIVRGEVEDYFLLERAINEYEVDTVIHLAAQTIVEIANRNPQSTFETNIKGTWNLLEACHRNPTVKTIIVASSDKAYGEPKELPYTEDTPLKGLHPYDVSKSCADLLSQAYYHTYKLPMCITRCGNFYGGGDLNFNRIIPGTIRSILFNQRPTIRSDGNYIRDYIYVMDAVNAYLLLARKMEDSNIWGDAFNFSNEIQTTVLDLVNEILRLMDREDLKPIIKKAANGEIRNQYLSAKKAREQLNWSPQYNLEQGLRETIEWYRGFFKEKANANDQ
ncbi:MAG: GDP-mannose 4,6-dehydratase [Methanotrichaceae archaeon]|nr:GDP-mannose 4,6-dehydratase [Methanotrichaceae archaeon]